MIVAHRAVHAARIFNSIRVSIALLILLSVKSKSFYTVLLRNQNTRWNCMLLTCCIMYMFHPYFVRRSFFMFCAVVVVHLFSFFSFIYWLVSVIYVPCATNKKFKILSFIFIHLLDEPIHHAWIRRKRATERRTEHEKHRVSRIILNE